MLIMNINTTFFPDTLLSGRKVFMVGIGGVSMSALAEVLLSRGVHILGSDRQQSDATKHLEELGAKIFYNEDISNLSSVDAVIRTAAARNDHPLIGRCNDLGIPLFERAEVWGLLSKEYTHSLCVAGTHGKTTTTSMAALIALAANADPTIMIGSTLPILNSGHRVGRGDIIILEACEYCNSYLHFSPTIAVILNVDEDHLDFFKDKQDIISSFKSFARLVPQDGFIVACTDDEGVRAVIDGIDKQVVPYGLNEKSGFHPRNLVSRKGNYGFDVFNVDDHITHIQLKTPGLHNVSNALAATASAFLAGISPSAIQSGLEAFTGAARRLEYKGNIGAVPVYDDYAHHPTEIEATLKAVRGMGFTRILLAFQPHTYSRTKSLFKDFVRILSDEGLIVYLPDIYAARELNEFNVSSEDLASYIPNAHYISDFKEIAESIKAEAAEGDVVITMGAGNVFEICDYII